MWQTICIPIYLNKSVYILPRAMRLALYKPCNMVVSNAQYATVKFDPRNLKITSSWKPSKAGECSVSTRETRLSHKWMEYQGIKNWEGLLDPLDDDLRSEILRYGGFVEAAYRSFEFDKSSSGKYGTCRYGRDSLLTQCGLGGIGYKVTKNLRATSGLQLPDWIDKTPSWVSTQSSWIGYVAVCTDKYEISRLGRRDVVIALRGTVTCLEWMENLRVTLTTLASNNEMDQSCSSSSSRAMVERGFLSLYTSNTATCPSLRDSIREEISRIIQTYGDKEALSLTITGHSLGAALATLTAYDISSTFNQLMTTAISFGGPRVGNKTFSHNLEKNGTRILRIVNSNDVITKVPGFVIEEDQHNRNKNKKKMKSGDQKLTTASLAARFVPTWLHKHVENTQWLYADVGKELRLCCNNSNKVTCHDLKTYLDLVNGFVSSTCPLRATAKNVLCRRAQHDQQQLLLR